MIRVLIDEIVGGQAENGAFLSRVDVADGLPVDDHNCCATALVTLELLACRGRLDRASVAAPVERALDFIEACANQDRATFCFYPGALDCRRLPVGLPSDWDDTALAWLTLVTAGRRSSAEADAALCDHLSSGQLRYRPGHEAPWVGRGAVTTWFSRPTTLNRVDAVVNANVAALAALVGGELEHRCHGVRAMVDRLAALDGAASGSMRRMAPYYAHPMELLYAVRRAVAIGAHALSDALKKLQRHAWSDEDRRLAWPRERPLFCNAHGRPRWRSPALQAARELSWRLGFARDAIV